MGIAIFLMAVAAEVAFAAFCIRTGSRQSRFRNIGRIGALAGFLLLLVLQLVTWGPSYYLLGALLLALAVRGAVQLVRGRDGTTPITGRRVAVTALGTAPDHPITRRARRQGHQGQTGTSRPTHR
ncbi:hypothetical protein [Pseudonocardia sp.]|uniref:hypothetical protein n=1 Tax=Pseudonocardia sp. TaxID=60912 RepID=UPI0026114AEA|nr:hypothetical protein [Pseudonocardia sp.]